MRAFRHGFCACAATAIALISIHVVEGIANGGSFASMAELGSDWIRSAFLLGVTALASGITAGAVRRDTDSPIAGAFLLAVVPAALASGWLANHYRLSPYLGSAWSYDAMAWALIDGSRKFGLLALGSASALGTVLPMWRELPPGRERRIAGAFVVLVVATLFVCVLGVGFRFSGRFVDEGLLGRFVSLRIGAAIGVLLGLAIAAALLTRVVWIARGELRVAIATAVAGAALLVPPVAFVLDGRSTRDVHRVGALLVEHRFEAIEVDGRTEDPDYAPDVVLSGHECFVVVERRGEYAYHEMNPAFELVTPTRPRRITGSDLDPLLAEIASEQSTMRDEVRSGRYLGGEEYAADQRLRAPDSVVLTVMSDRHARGPALARVVSSAIRARFERIDFVVMRGTQGAWRTPRFLRSVFPGLEFARSDFRRVSAFASDRSEGSVAAAVETLRVGPATGLTNLVRRIASLHPGTRPVLVVVDR